MQDLLATAIEMHQAGQVGPAGQLYERILNEEQENADALHLLGVVRHQQRDYARAVELITRAVALRPNVPAFHSNLAEAFRSLGQFDRAIGCCRTALRLYPDYAEALCNLGLALQGLGRHAEAVEEFERALKLRPDLASAHSNLGISLRELGKTAEALSHFERAVELDPNSPPARTNLGQILIDSGRAEEALPHCQEAVRLEPNVPAMHHNLGNAYRALSKFVDARAGYLEAIRLDPNFAASHAHLGLALHQEGQLGEALAWLKQAVELEPQNPLYWEYLADLHTEREFPADAIPCWQRVLELDPNRASAHNGLGWALQDEGQPAEAEKHFRKALALSPDFAAAQMNLGGLHEELGNLEEAETAFRESQRLQPAYALPHARLATLLRGKLPDDDCTRLKERLEDPQLTEAPKARLLFALAHVLDAKGDYPGAADCLRRANALTVELDRRRKRNYVPEEHERFVESVLGAFGAEFFSQIQGAGLKTRRPVFVFGLPRSGTTLIEQVLASHPQIHGAGELRLARQSFEGIPREVGSSELPLACVGRLDARALEALATRHDDQLAALAGRRADRVVDKMPDNYMYLGLLAALFPDAVFIHCRRDLRDIAVSCWMTDFRSIRWANDPEHVASRFRQYRRLMSHWRAVLPVRIHDLDYEETVADIEAAARRLVAACGLAWDPACVEFHRTRRVVRTASITQVRQPVYKHSVARWKNYERDLAGLFEALPPAEEKLSDA